MHDINIHTSKPLYESEKFKINNEQLPKKTKQKNKSNKVVFKQSTNVDKGSWRKIVFSFQKLVNKKNELNLSYFQYIKEYSCCSKSKIYNEISITLQLHTNNR